MRRKHRFFKKLLLPEGVYSLSTIDANNDIREIEKTLPKEDIDYDDDDDDDDDSEDIDPYCSFESDDVLSSSYPAKPRKGTKPPCGKKGVPGVTETRIEFADRKAAQEALAFITKVKSIHRELYDLEIRREQFESVKVSYEQSLQNTSRDYQQNKEEQENYLRVLQALYIRALKLHSVYSRRISMLYDLYHALQSRRNAIDSFNSYIESFKSATHNQPKATNKHKGDILSTLGIVNGETNMLKVNLVKSKRYTVLYKGQKIITPVGEGHIASIFPNSLKITIKLSYGMMHSNISRVALWSNRDEIIDAASSKALHAKWSCLKNRISVSEDIEDKISALINDVVEAQNATDKENDVSDNVSHKQNEGNNNDNNDSHIQEKDAKSSVFPIIVPKNKGTKIGPRNAIRNKLGYKSFLPDRMSNPLPLAFAPANTISYLLKNLLDTHESKLNICYDSLVSEEDESLVGITSNTASLTWSGDLPKMRFAIRAIIDEVDEAENQQRYNLDQIQVVRTKMCSLSTEMALIRLRMHNRRVHHQELMRTSGINVSSSFGVVVIETKNDNAEISHGGGADNCLADNSSFAHVDDAMSSLIMSVANNDEDDIDTANIMTSMLSNKRLQSQLGSTSTKVEIARDSRSNKNNIDLKGSENKDTDGDVTDAKSRKKPKRGKLLNGKIFSKSKLQLNLPQKPPNKMAGICH